MKYKKLIIGITVISPFVLFAIISFFTTRFNEPIIEFTKNYPLVAPLIIIGWRIVGMVIPPIPGGAVSIAMIPIFGWFWSFIYASVGLLIGCSISFLLARKYREPLVEKFVPLKQLHTWEDKVSDNMHFATFVAIRFTTGPVLDFISYVAGLSKISFTKFFIATALTLIPDALFYYLGDNIYQASTPVALASLMLFVLAYYVLQKAKFFELLKDKFKK